MLIPPSYNGREQSYLKHQLLRGYLEKLIMIVGHGRATHINFVDCFAGPWPDNNVSLNDTSIGVSLEIMRRCRITYAQHGWAVPSFRALYLEKDHVRFLRLKGLLAEGPREVQTTALCGEFTALSEEILGWCGPRDFTFFFVDPTGWKEVSLVKLQPLLERPNSEFLINFMYDFVNRAVPQERFSREMRELFGQDIEHFPELVTKTDREFLLLRMYQQRLLKAGPKDGSRVYSASVRVMNPYQERSKYHLVYITRHPKGIKEFMEQSEALENIQPLVRNQAKFERTIKRKGSAQTAFALDDLSGRPDDLNDPLAAPASIDVKEYWLSKLTTTAKAFGLEEMVEVLSETGCYPSTLQKALGELIAEGRVKNLDAKRKRTKNHVD